ncbi:hypothetical protein [Photobacterium leiognathi]|uniref:hypothetical protein n=1 Tax=Photobacterium leiognathi TaxID=553611 RepID=UPI00298187F4|nr:hypothetical protein [Photobacterium leiognathi]
MSNFKYQSIVVLDTGAKSTEGAGNYHQTLICMPYGSLNYQICEPLTFGSLPVDEITQIVQETTLLLDEIHKWNVDELEEELVGFAQILHSKKFPILPKFYDAKNRTFTFGGNEILNQYFQDSGTRINFGTKIATYECSDISLNSEQSIIENVIGKLTNAGVPIVHRHVIFVDGVCRYSENDLFTAIPFSKYQDSVSLLVESQSCSIFGALI